jgi:hypothetical protein
MIAMGASAVGLMAGAWVVATKFLPGEFWLLAVGGLWLETAVLGYLMLRGARSDWFIPLFSASAVVSGLLVFGLAAHRASDERRIEAALAASVEELHGAPIATYRCLESSWIFYTRQPIWELATDDMSASSNLERGRPWDSKPRVAPATFALLHPNAVLVTTNEHWNELESRLPTRYRIVRNVGYFPRDKTLLIAVPESLVSQRRSPRVAKWKDAGIRTY